MRIWAFPSFYPHDHPGMQWHGIFAHRQYKALADCGADIKVIQPVKWFPPGILSSLDKEWKELSAVKYPEQRVYDGITVYHPRIANMKPSRIFNRVYSEQYVKSVVNFFRKNKININPREDIFYSQWVPEANVVQAAAKALSLKSAILVIGDDVLVWPHGNKECMRVFKETMIGADIRLSVAQYLATEANKLLGKEYSFNVVRRGVNYDFFAPLPHEARAKIKNEYGVPDGKMVILTIGTPIVRKGWLDLFDALKEVKKVNRDFVLVGAHGGTPEFNLSNEAAARGLTEQFIDLGEVAPKNINKLYNIADIFCLPSHWEGIANSVVEAMSTGLPVITTNVCGHPELIRNGDTGIMVAPKAPADLSEALLLLLNDESRRKSLGEHARQFIVNDWGSFKENAVRLYKVFETALAAG